MEQNKGWHLSTRCGRMVRLSYGLEDAEDLIADLRQALDGVVL